MKTAIEHVESCWPFIHDVKTCEEGNDFRAKEVLRLEFELAVEEATLPLRNEMAGLAARYAEMAELHAKKRSVLEEIAHATGSMPAAYGMGNAAETSWFSSQFYAQVGKAARAIAPPPVHCNTCGRDFSNDVAYLSAGCANGNSHCE